MRVKCSAALAAVALACPLVAVAEPRRCGRACGR
jgi:hypothetical protein